MIADAPARRPLVPHGGNDCIDTPDDLAELIVAHFKPTGRVLEPCRGGGAFVRALTASGCECEYCEIKEGIDFLTVEGYWPWIVTNPPWSQFRAFLKKSMQVADNIVFLTLSNAWLMRARQRDIKAEGFGLVEILEVPVPPKPWPQFGICLGAAWLRRGWKGSTWIHSASEPERPTETLTGQS
jgi:hypothetical protein